MYLLLLNLIKDGVYRSGFAQSQSAYEKAVHEVFDSLDKVEKILDGKDYLIGDRLTEADIRLFVTIVSSATAWFYDALAEQELQRYVSTRYTSATLSVTSELYETGIQPLTCKRAFHEGRGQTKGSHRWMRKLYWNIPAFKDNTNFDHIKTHYYWSHTSVSPEFFFLVRVTL